MLSENQLSLSLSPLIIMAIRFLSLTIFILLFLISAKGRSLQQKELRGKFVNKAVSSPTSDPYTTNYTDVLALGEIVAQFPSLLEANVDPCILPVWDWIQCSSDPTPRVVALNLNNRLLYGQLINDFSSLDALQRIDFSQNFIYGDIPSFVGTLPDLQELNLASNYFTGAVPDSIACNKNLKLTLTGNPYLTSYTCSKTSKKSPSPPSNSNPDVGVGNVAGGVGGNGLVFQVPSSNSIKTTKKKKSNLPAILGGTIPSFVVFWAAIGGYAAHRQRSKAAAAAMAVANTTKQGPTGNVPMEELPMNAGPNEMSP